MTLSSVVLQILTGLASASALFLVASGLSLIFGVTRIVNFAHGSFYMLGLYAAVALASAVRAAGPLGFWGAVLLAALAVAALGALIEMLVLRRLYAAPELYQLLATFALVLVIRDAALWAWGPEDILGPRAPGLTGRDRRPRPALSELRRVLDLRRPGRPRPALAAADEDALGPARARRDAGPRDGRRARRQPALALHLGVRARHLPRGARRRACRCRTSRPT